jgi:hypothetical protein
MIADLDVILAAAMQPAPCRVIRMGYRFDPAVACTRMRDLPNVNREAIFAQDKRPCQRGLPESNRVSRPGLDAFFTNCGSVGIMH